jgi:hypothetical protein
LRLRAGIIARTKIGGRISGWFEASFFDSFPKYQTFKSMAQGLEQLEGTDHGLKPALVSAEGGWQIGYLLEPLENDWVAVFIPVIVGNSIRLVIGNSIRLVSGVELGDALG